MAEDSGSLGDVGATDRGFEYVEFKDRNGHLCSLQESSVVEDEENPHGCLWLGPNDPEPQILVEDAARLGLLPRRWGVLPPKVPAVGWMEFDIPEEVSCRTRMHLNRSHVEELVRLLQNWLGTGSLSTPSDGAVEEEEVE